ncbi:MAG: 50S ribosomal protein L3 [Bacteroidota bacterium]
MVGIIGRKIGMTSLHEERRIIPCTVIQVGDCIITQIKTLQHDGYSAVQLAYDDKKIKNTTQPLLKHFEKANTTPKKELVEFRNFSEDCAKDTIRLGDTITAKDIFEEGEFIDVVGISKGKGFQGVVKRHGFKGVGDQTHGQHNRQKAPGAIGAGSDPSRVFKGTRMAGRMGNNRVKVKNLRVIKILQEEGLMILLGAVPGPKNSYVRLEK